jgi:hypothetical protein
VGCGCHSGRTSPFGVAGLRERRRLARNTSGSPSTTCVPSDTFSRNPAPLDPRKHRNNAISPSGIWSPSGRGFSALVLYSYLETNAPDSP